MTTLHDEITGLMASNNWPYAYACGYASGKDDGQNKRKRQHSTDEKDDCALGYHRGYAVGATSQRVQADLAKALSILGL